VGQEGVGKIHLETTTAFHARHRNVGGSNLIGSKHTTSTFHWYKF